MKIDNSINLTYTPDELNNTLDMLLGVFKIKSNIYNKISINTFTDENKPLVYNIISMAQAINRSQEVYDTFTEYFAASDQLNNLFKKDNLYIDKPITYTHTLARTPLNLQSPTAEALLIKSLKPVNWNDLPIILDHIIHNVDTIYINTDLFDAMNKINWPKHYVPGAIYEKTINGIETHLREDLPPHTIFTRQIMRYKGYYIYENTPDTE